MKKINYAEILGDITKWKGCKKDFWFAYQLLVKYGKLSTVEIKRFKREGLTCYTEDVINFRMKELKELCESNIPKPEPPKEVIETKPVKKKGNKQNK